MNPEQWRRLRGVFEAALGLQGAERESFLRESCGEDNELRSEIDAMLLLADQNEDDFLEVRVVDAESPGIASVQASYEESLLDCLSAIRGYVEQQAGIDPHEQGGDSKDDFAQASLLNEKEAQNLLGEQLRQHPEIQNLAILLLNMQPELQSSEVKPGNRAGGVTSMIGDDGYTFGEFELVKELGRGGMGIVYLAKQSSLDRFVAVKLLHAIKNEEAVRRFQREAHSASRLNHAGIVSVLSSGSESGHAWYAMQYIKGHDLGREIELYEEHDSANYLGKLLLPRFGAGGYVQAIVRKFVQVCDAVEYAHSNGIVHRDIKPQNILVDERGELFLTDFGLARDERFGSISSSGQIQGTIHYMSPEQSRVDSTPIDHRTDIYSLCVVLYELLSHRRPYEGQSAEQVLANIGSGNSISLRQANPRIPQDLALICEKGMSYSADARYSTASELSSDLHRFLHHEAINAKAPTAVQRARSWARRNRLTVRAVGIAAAIVVVLQLSSVVVNDARREVELKRRIQVAMDEPEWGSNVELVAEARRAAIEAADASFRFPEMDDFTNRLSEYREAEEARIRSVYDQLAFEPDPDDLSNQVDRRVVFETIARAGRLRAVFGQDDAAVRRLAEIERVWPKLSILLSWSEQEEVSVAAEIVAVDPVTGLFSEDSMLGELPMIETPVAPGDYRIVIRANSRIVGEYDRSFDIGDPLETIVYDGGIDGASKSGMINISGGTLMFDSPAKLGCSQVSDRVEVAPFWIDETEVSNGEFVQFLESTSWRAPHYWTKHLGFEEDWREMDIVKGDPRWLDLPVVGVSWQDARAYAEWLGKRLPTHFELEFAYRGETGQLTPPARANAYSKPDVEARGSQLKRYAEYLRSVVNVKDEAYRHPPFGLIHAFGNVYEWTSSKVTEPRRGRVWAHRYDRIYMGGCWYSGFEGRDFSTHASRGDTDAYAIVEIGFRCATSAQ